MIGFRHYISEEIGDDLSVISISEDICDSYEQINELLDICLSESSVNPYTGWIQAAKTLTRQAEVTPTKTYGQFQHLSMKERIAQSIARAQR